MSRYRMGLVPPILFLTLSACHFRPLVCNSLFCPVLRHLVQRSSVVGF